MGYVRACCVHFPRGVTDPTVKSVGPGGDDDAASGAAMPCPSAGAGRNVQQRHRPATGLVPAHCECDAGRISSGRYRGDPAGPETETFSPGPIQGVGAADSGYDPKDQAARWNPLERPGDGPATGRIEDAGAAGLAAF